MRKSRIRSGTVTHITVIHASGRIILGNGWIFTCEHGGMDKPVLIDSAGNRLEDGWYTLEPTSTVLAICSDRTH